MKLNRREFRIFFDSIARVSSANRTIKHKEMYENVRKNSVQHLCLELTCIYSFFLLLWWRILFNSLFPGRDFRSNDTDGRFSVDLFGTVFFFYYVLCAVRIAIVFCCMKWATLFDIQFTRLRSDNKNKNGCCSNTFNWHHDRVKRRAIERQRSG